MPSSAGELGKLGWLLMLGTRNLWPMDYNFQHPWLLKMLDGDDGSCSPTASGGQCVSHPWLRHGMAQMVMVSVFIIALALAIKRKHPFIQIASVLQFISRISTSAIMYGQGWTKTTNKAECWKMQIKEHSSSCSPGMWTPEGIVALELS